MKLYGIAHTDRDPLTIEFHGVGIDLSSSFKSDSGSVIDPLDAKFVHDHGFNRHEVNSNMKLIDSYM